LPGYCGPWQLTWQLLGTGLSISTHHVDSSRLGQYHHGSPALSIQAAGKGSSLWSEESDLFWDSADHHLMILSYVERFFGSKDSFEQHFDTLLNDLQKNVDNLAVRSMSTNFMCRKTAVLLPACMVLQGTCVDYLEGKNYLLRYVHGFPKVFSRPA